MPKASAASRRYGQSGFSAGGRMAGFDGCFFFKGNYHCIVMRSSIPKNARERVAARHPNGAKQRTLLPRRPEGRPANLVGIGRVVHGMRRQGWKGSRTLPRVFGRRASLGGTAFGWHASRAGAILRWSRPAEGNHLLEARHGSRLVLWRSRRLAHRGAVFSRWLVARPRTLVLRGSHFPGDLLQTGY